MRINLLLLLCASCTDATDQPLNHMPTTEAVAIIDAPTAVQRGATAYLSGDQSTGGRLDFSWRVDSGPPQSVATIGSRQSARATFEPDKKGTYVVSLQVSNGSGRTDSATVEIESLNNPPEAVLEPMITTSQGGLLDLDGSASFDQDGDLITYEWALLSAPAGSLGELMNTRVSTSSLVLDILGNYIVQLTVNDGALTHRSEVEIEYNDGNLAPIADAGPDLEARLGEPIEVDGSASRDPEGDSLAYAWRILRSPQRAMPILVNGASATPTLEFDHRGTYVLELTVTDGRNHSSADEVSIQVLGPRPLVDTFDPEQIYLLGQVNDDRCSLALAPLSYPQGYVAGFNCRAEPMVIRPTDGRMIYMDDANGPVREFRCDSCEGQVGYPRGPTYNDPRLTGSICDGPNDRLIDFLVGVQGEILVRCRATGWQDLDGNRFGSERAGVLSYGHDGYALVYDRTPEIRNLRSGFSVPVSGLPVTRWPIVRARLDGFWVVLPEDGEERPKLFHVSFRGIVTDLGTYPEPPQGYRPGWRSSSALDSAGTLFGLIYGDDGTIAVISQPLNGTSQVVYRPNRFSELQFGRDSALITGP